jgi:hypothetical protein
MDNILGKIYLDETGEAPFVVFEGKAAATKEYICWLERIVAEERGVAALQTTNSRVMPCESVREKCSWLTRYGNCCSPVNYPKCTA